MNGFIRRFCAVCALFALLAGLLPLLPEGQAATRAFELYIGRAGETDENSLTEMPTQLVRAYKSGTSKYYFFIPDSWDPSEIRVFIEGRDSFILDKTTYTSGQAISLPLNQKMTFQADRNGTKFTLTAMQLSSLPTIFIETESGSDEYINKSKENKEAAYMYMVDPDGTVEYDGPLEYIRIRGNSTSNYPKKPYQIKLANKTSLCGMEKDKKWILLANYVDKAAVRNTLALGMARYSGAYSYVPDCQSVDVFLNHDYVGLYLLTEKAEIDKNRLNIHDLEAELEELNSDIDLADTKGKSIDGIRPGARKYHVIPVEPEDVTGGYLLQGNKELRYGEEESGFITSRRYYFTLQQPKYATEKEIDYLASLFQSIEDAIFSSDGYDPRTGLYYTELVDLDTFVNRYLQVEITDDYDIQLSYLYKDRDSVDSTVYFGPVWDQDNILGSGKVRLNSTRLRRPNSSTDTWYWLTRAMKHDDFKTAVMEAYTDTYVHVLDVFLGNATDETGTVKSIDEYAAEVRASAQADLILHPVSQRNKIANLNEDTGKTFDENIKYIKRYLKERKAALDKAYLIK